jgi:hypothetical protein
MSQVDETGASPSPSAPASPPGSMQRGLQLVRLRSPPDECIRCTVLRTVLLECYGTVVVHPSSNILDREDCTVLSPWQGCEPPQPIVVTSRPFRSVSGIGALQRRPLIGRARLWSLARARRLSGVAASLTPTLPYEREDGTSTVRCTVRYVGCDSRRRRRRTRATRAHTSDTEEMEEMEEIHGGGEAARESGGSSRSSVDLGRGDDLYGT